jgi:hypothetical protein
MHGNDSGFWMMVLWIDICRANRLRLFFGIEVKVIDFCSMRNILLSDSMHEVIIKADQDGV